MSAGSAFNDLDIEHYSDHTVKYQEVAGKRIERVLTHGLPLNNRTPDEYIEFLARNISDDVFGLVSRDDPFSSFPFFDNVMGMFNKYLGRRLNDNEQELLLQKLRRQAVLHKQSICDQIQPQLDTLRAFVTSPEANERKVVDDLAYVRQYASLEFWILSIKQYEAAHRCERRQNLITHAAEVSGDLVNFSVEIIRHIRGDMEFTPEAHA